MKDPLVNDLRSAVASGEVLVIVGTGVSVAATNNAPTASWKGLLEHGVDYCAGVDPDAPAGWSNRTLQQIQSGDVVEMLAAAYQVERRLKRVHEFRNWLRAAMSDLRPSSPAILTAIGDLASPLATTNYDDLLEQALGMRPVPWTRHADTERVIRGHDSGVLHIHGFWREPDSVVLGPESYDRVTSDPHAQAMLRALRMTRTLLFVGCGDGVTDPNIGGLLEWAREVSKNSEYRHYRLGRSSDLESMRSQHRPEDRVVVLSYGDEHDDLPAYLKSLGRRSPPHSPTAQRPDVRLPPCPRCLGRGDVLEAMIAALLSPHPSPVLVSGPPGIGKSTIALTAAHDPRVARAFADRRYLVRCTSIDSSEMLYAAIAAELGLPLLYDRKSRVLEFLAQAPALVVLDNTETPWEKDMLGIEELLGHLAAIPRLALVVTMRGTERPFGVDWHEPFRIAPLDALSARDVFLATAGEQCRDHPKLMDVVAAVDCVPHALVLLATLAASTGSLDSVWEAWTRERTVLLRRGNASDRFTNLAVSFEVSICSDRMDDSARRLLALIALLPDGLRRSILEALFVGATAAARRLQQVGLTVEQGDRLALLAPLREHVRANYPPRQEDVDVTWAFYERAARAMEAETAAVAFVSAEKGNIESLLSFMSRHERPLQGSAGADLMMRFSLMTGIPSSALRSDVSILVAQLDDDDRWEDAAELLVSIGEPAVAALERLRESRRFPLRRRAAQVLDQILTRSGHALPNPQRTMERG